MEESPLYTKILDRMRRLCSMREYCSSDIGKKVTRMLGKEDSAFAESVLSALEADGYLSDERYAAAFARDKSSLSGWGPTKIKYALSSKGISDEIIAKALGEVDAGKAATRLEQILSVKYKSLAASAVKTGASQGEVRQKLVRFAFSRGYAWDEISSALDRVMDKEGV